MVCPSWYLHPPLRPSSLVRRGGIFHGRLGMIGTSLQAGLPAVQAKGGVSMERYGVIKVVADGSRLWVCPNDDLSMAKTKMLTEAGRTGKEHFVFDFRLELVVATSIETGKVCDRGAH